MHKWLFAFLLVALPTWGQQSSTGNLTAQGTVCASNTVCITLPLDQTKGGAGFTLSGTWSGTVQFEGSADGGVTYQALNATPSNSTTAVTSATANGVWQANVAGFTHVRIRCSAFSSGPIVATINGSSASARTGGSGGGFTSLAAGTNSNVGNFNWSQAGVFTSTQQNNNYSFIVTGGNTCVPGFAAENTTGALQGVICSPSAGVGNPLLYNAVEGWATNNFAGLNGNATNAFFGDTLCVVGGSECELMSGGINDTTGQSNTLLVGYEADIGVRNASTTGYGFFAEIQTNTQSNNFVAYEIHNSGGTGQFTHGFRCGAGTISNATNIDPCLFMDGQATTGNYNSNSIWAAANSTTNGAVTGSFSLAYPGFWEVRQPLIHQQVSGGIAGAGIFLTSTAGLSKNQLVKIDTAHADSVVVCTTADTSCDGFVADQLGSANGGFCTAASAFCGIITMPGSLVKGIIGTSTCAIGNFVIVDTTTNGDIQCTGTPPTIGKVIGKALSACASTCAGTTIDVLTKFE